MINFKNSKVLVVGDVMLDQFVHGKVSRISPEAPIPVLRVQKKVSKLGGAANVAKNLADLGATVILASVVNADDAGNEILNLLDNSGIESSIVIDKSRPTTVKTRFMSDNHHILRSDEEEIDNIYKPTEDSLFAQIMDSLDYVDVVVLSDYNKGVLTETLIQKIIKNTKKPIIVDPKKPNFKPYRGCTYITPNEQELFAGTLTKDLNLGADIALAQSEAKAILLTRSEKGMAYIEGSKEPILIPTVAKNVVDVCGAGDTVVATFAACLAAGYTEYDAMVMANKAAGIVVGKPGTASVSIVELEADQYLNQKILDVLHAESLISLWKSQGLKIGFTNGCFDIIHPGHVTMLQKCKDNCDRLIVGLNSDQSVKRLKGKSRPVQNEIARATVLSGLSSVDLVIVFEEDTPYELIHLVKPSILMKGGDYKADDVVGGDVVVANGGQVKIIDFEDGHSTTNIIKKLKK